MKTRDLWIEDFTMAPFQKAFKVYFAELGIQIRDWDALFAEMNNDPNGKTYACVRMAEEEVVGFVMLTMMDMKSWFFQAKAGFVREFWIAEVYRGAGNGAELLALAEAYFVRQGAIVSLLTTDTAQSFYEKRGYTRTEKITAVNHDPVMIKRL